MSISKDARVTSKGQVTIPKRIRDEFGIEAGQDVEFVITDEGELKVRTKDSPMERLRDIQNRVRGREESIDVDEIRRRAKREWSSLDEGGEERSGSDGEDA